MKFLPALAFVCFGGCASAFCDSFVILPFFNLSDSSNLGWIGESVSETIRESLASKGIITFNREHRKEAYRRLSMREDSQLTKATVMRVGEVLDADQVIFGSFELSGAEPASKSRGTLRLTAQIINMRSLTRGPEYAEIGALEDLARLESHLAWQTLQFVLGKDAPSEAEFRRTQPVLRIDAIESYVRGLLAATPDQKMKLFSQAVRIESKYSQASFHLAKLHYDKKSYKLAADYLQRVTPADMNYRAATFLLGLCRYRMGDFGGAEQAFQQVAAAVPLNEVLNNLAASQSRINSPAAMDNFKKALDGDSNDPDYHFNVGYMLFKQGDLAAATERFRAVLDRDPDDSEAITMLGRCLTKQKAAHIAKGPIQSEGLERLKENYEESAYLQLKAVLERKR